jgi:hypothetical protein
LRDADGMSVLIDAHVIPPLRRALPTLVAAVLAVTYLIVDPTGADLPAQLLRTKLFGAEGFGIWNNWWYGGHNVTAYSVLFPPLAWLTSPQLIAAIASVASAAAFEALAHGAYGDDAWVGATWFAAVTVTELLSGRLTFAFGLCGAVLTALLLQRRRSRSTAVVAFLTALASPVAALFAALAGATMRKPVVVAAALLPVIGLALAFPEGGQQPFAFGTLWPVMLAGFGLLLLRPGRVITTATCLYLAGCVIAFLIPTAVGSNAARLGELVAGPLFALVLVPRRAWLLLALAAVPLTYIQVHDSIIDLKHGEVANTAAYYRPLIGFLDRQPGARQHLWRVEVPFTAGHWEAYRLEPQIPLARGWERQLDIRDDGLFYDGRLTPSSYRAWLQRLAVRYVAAADAPVDPSARQELRLIADGLPYLKLVAKLRHWRVYAVTRGAPLATGVARVTYMGPNSLSLFATRPGQTYLRVRWSSYWQLTGVHGCVEPAGAFTRVRFHGSGRARLVTSFSVGRIRASSPRCA